MDDRSIFWIAMLIASGMAWPIYNWLLRMKARQTVSAHVAEHAHKQGTPTMGGLIILAGLIPSMVLAKMPAGLVTLAITFGLIGFVDDFVVPRLMKGKRGLGWLQKLALQVGSAGISVYLLSPSGPLAFGVAVFAILFFSNAYNFTDGLDWLAGSVLVALCFGGVWIAAVVYSPVSLTLFLALVGASIPFLILNRPPAKLFMGDVGSMPVGALLGISLMSIAWPKVAPAVGAVANHSLALRPISVLFALAILSFVMAAELIPVPLQILSVKLRKKRLFPMTPIHHAFQKAGWKETRVVSLFFAVQVACSILAMAMAGPVKPQPVPLNSSEVRR